MVAHAGCLSFEMSVTRQRLIINCGVPMPGQVASPSRPHHRRAFDGDAERHVVLPFRARSWVGEWLGEAIVSGPTQVEVEREHGGRRHVLAMRHNGYVDRFGLVHERKLNLAEAGDRLDGAICFCRPRASLAGRSPRRLRHPLPSPSERARHPLADGHVVMELPDGRTRDARRNPCIRLSDAHGRVQQSASVAWQMHRTTVGGRRQRLLTGRQRRVPTACARSANVRCDPASHRHASRPRDAVRRPME